MLIEELYSIYLNCTHICTDSRKVENKSIFFSLQGDNFNGNTYAEIALNNGCSFAVIDDVNYYKDNRYILVDNTLKILQDLAKYHRSKLKIPIIGITGTNGKTTTKELLNAVLSKKYNTLATIGNLNNHIGVPQTILKTSKFTEIAIIEMGANHLGEIAELCEIAQPNFGIITNIGKAHLEGFGSIEGIIKTKSELYNWIRKKEGTLFVNGDNPILTTLSENIKRITYGNSSNNNYSANIVAANPYLEVELINKNTNKLDKIKSKLVGSYNFENILAAIAIGNYFNVDRNSIINAIESYTPTNNRSQIIKTEQNRVIMDAYNANPSSMEASINNFATIAFDNKVVILGDMLELGNESEKEHLKILELANKKKFDKIILVGKIFNKINNNSEIPTFKGTDDLAIWLKINKIMGKTIFVKGSRGIKLENILNLL